MDLMEAVSLEGTGKSSPGPATSATTAGTGFVAGTTVADLSGDSSSLPIFDVERVQLQFSIAADFGAAQVANNVMVLALSNGRILRIDLNKPEDIDDIDLPKKPADTGVIRRMFLDPTASHLIICTSLGDNYYLHSQARHPRPLHRLRGVQVECVAWNPALPTTSTREIIVGAADGNLYETFVEPHKDRYVHMLRKLTTPGSSGGGAIPTPITGVWVDQLAEKDRRRIMVSTKDSLYHLVGRIGGAGTVSGSSQGHGGGAVGAVIGSVGGVIGGSHEGSRSIYAAIFDSETPVVEEFALTSPSSFSQLVVSPDPSAAVGASGSTYDDPADAAAGHPDRAFAWLSAQGAFHGTLLTSPATTELGKKVFSGSTLIPKTKIVSKDAPTKRGGGLVPEMVESIALTQWHVVLLVGGRVVVINRLSGSKVYDQVILDSHQKAIGMTVDLHKNTFWLFTTQEIFEIVVREEDRDIWKIMLEKQQFDAAMKHARTPLQKDAVSVAYGDHLTAKSQYLEAAAVWGRSSKPFEEVALALIDAGQQDALRRYLLTKLQSFPKSSVMQRTMIATWLVEVFMAKLNSLDDTLVTKAELSTQLTPSQTQEQLVVVQSEFQDFIRKFKGDLDSKTVYDVIASHGREEELLYFANIIDDYNYVLSYWVERSRWSQALQVLKKQTDPEVFYKYASVLMTHAPVELVEILMRHPDLQPRRLIPALLEYEKRNQQGVVDGSRRKVPLERNQAVRYLQYVINQLGSTDSAVHNTLVSIFAASPEKDETMLLAYLEQQQQQQQVSNSIAMLTQPDGGAGAGSETAAGRVKFDPDFALRLCIQNKRVLSCVSIYTGMGQYAQAVDLALAHGEIDLAAATADMPQDNPTLRKKLWLSVARTVIRQRSSAENVGGKKGKAGGAGSGIKTAIEFLQRCNNFNNNNSNSNSNSNKNMSEPTLITITDGKPHLPTLASSTGETTTPAPLLRIEDLIPFFPDFVVIDDFKEEICGALERYSRSIDGLKRDMDRAASAASHMHAQLRALDARYAVVEPAEPCRHCTLPLLTSPFYVFPCQHSFHEQCLVALLVSAASAPVSLGGGGGGGGGGAAGSGGVGAQPPAAYNAVLRRKKDRILDLQMRISKGLPANLSSSNPKSSLNNPNTQNSYLNTDDDIDNSNDDPAANFNGVAATGGDSTTASASQQQQQQQRRRRQQLRREEREREKEELIREFDALVGAECVLCGDMAIRRIDEPFVGEGEGADEWAL